MKSAPTFLFAFLSLFPGWVFAAQHEYPKARITARVLDEDGNPIPNANIRFVFCTPTDAGAIVPVEGVTDYSGMFTGEGYCNGSYSVTIKKRGYYESGLGAPKLTDIKDGHWIPWDTTANVVLRAVRKPVPMYAKTSWLEIPATDEACGYDLSAGDWVSPHGKGRIADFVFTLHREEDAAGSVRATVKLGFSGVDDGIQEVVLPEVWRYSAFKWPRQAPEDDYRPSLETSFVREPRVGSSGSAKLDDAYFFRIRVVKQNGSVVSGLFGKITSGFLLGLSHTKTAKVKLSYLMNPTSLDRNMEWDTVHNLISGVGSLETPREP